MYLVNFNDPTEVKPLERYCYVGIGAYNLGMRVCVCTGSVYVMLT